MMTIPARAEMERAFFSADPEYDGVFYTAVRTTGIFCRPSCTAKKPRPENVEFFATSRDALFAGYRPCKRCQPMQRGSEAPAWVSKLLGAVEQNRDRRFPDEELRAMEIDPVRARRYFQKQYGMTFQEYCRARRLAGALDSMRGGGALDDAVFDAGFSSHSGFREAFGKLFGMAPGQSRGAECIRADWIDTPVGPMLACALDEGLCLLEFTDRRLLEGQFARLRTLMEKPVVPGEHQHIDQVREELAAYFRGELRQFQTPMTYPGSAFERQVWDELQRIPYGETRSYEQLAAALGRPGAQRAVGHANGCNRIAILIPCHRVVRKSGELGGYGGGLWRKRFLLEIERGGPERLF
jgi:AraC family transcriptional regulator of adaptative response/methylated-DNA-[protein]-cysteine methyltransferase